MSKNGLIKRLEGLEQLENPSGNHPFKVVIFEEATGYTSPDFTGRLTPEAFKEWQAKQTPDTEITIVEIVENKPPSGGQVP